jgi:Flp pilus assembly protein TadB
VHNRHEVYRITSAQPGPTAEQRSRERTYLLMMGTRMVAIVVAVTVPGFWRIVAVAAGVLLPYIAVVMVNAVHARDESPAEPGFVPTHKPELTGSPFEGVVVPDDARDIDAP